MNTVVDPGFPIGGRAPIRWGVDLRHGYFLVKMCAKTKELGPMGGVRRARPLDPPMEYNEFPGYCILWKQNRTKEEYLCL